LLALYASYKFFTSKPTAGSTPGKKVKSVAVPTSVESSENSQDVDLQWIPAHVKKSTLRQRAQK
jgi:hypothetical protein